MKKKNQLKIVIFTAVKYRCILHGNVCVMDETVLHIIVRCIVINFVFVVTVFEFSLMLLCIVKFL